MKQFVIDFIQGAAGLLLILIFGIPCVILFLLACIPGAIYCLTPMGRRDRRITKEQALEVASRCENKSAIK